MVKYRQDEDLGLDMHHDDSDVTLNVCLGFVSRAWHSAHRARNVVKVAYRPDHKRLAFFQCIVIHLGLLFPQRLATVRGVSLMTPLVCHLEAAPLAISQQIVQACASVCERMR
eukprot:286842-Pleurochrysis_carterae.AAC.2